MSRKFILACSKPWGEIAFRHLIETVPGEWLLVKSQETLKEHVDKEVSVLFFLHWNWKIPQEYFLKFDCIGFHMTDLPFGRGGSPLQNLISRGIDRTKLTAFRISEVMDAGPILIKKDLELWGRAEEIYVRAALLACQMIKEILDGDFSETEQIGEPVFFKRRKPSESEIVGFDNILDLYNHLRMLDAPTYPNAYFKHGHFKYEFSQVFLNNGTIQATVHITEDMLD